MNIEEVKYQLTIIFIFIVAQPWMRNHEIEEPWMRQFMLGKPQKKNSGPATKALPSPSPLPKSSLVATFFEDFFRA